MAERSTNFENIGTALNEADRFLTGRGSFAAINGRVEASEKEGVADLANGRRMARHGIHKELNRVSGKVASEIDQNYTHYVQDALNTASQLVEGERSVSEIDQQRLMAFMVHSGHLTEIPEDKSDLRQAANEFLNNIRAIAPDFSHPPQDKIIQDKAQLRMLDGAMATLGYYDHAEIKGEDPANITDQQRQTAISQLSQDTGQPFTALAPTERVLDVATTAVMNNHSKYRNEFSSRVLTQSSSQISALDALVWNSLGAQSVVIKTGMTESQVPQAQPEEQPFNSSSPDPDLDATTLDQDQLSALENKISELEGQLEVKPELANLEARRDAYLDENSEAIDAQFAAEKEDFKAQLISAGYNDEQVDFHLGALNPMARKEQLAALALKEENPEDYGLSDQQAYKLLESRDYLKNYIMKDQTPEFDADGQLVEGSLSGTADTYLQSTLADTKERYTMMDYLNRPDLANEIDKNFAPIEKRLSNLKEVHAKAQAGEPINQPNFDRLMGTDAVAEARREEKVERLSSIENHQVAIVDALLETPRLKENLPAEFQGKDPAEIAAMFRGEEGAGRRQKLLEVVDEKVAELTQGSSGILQAFASTVSNDIHQGVQKFANLEQERAQLQAQLRNTGDAEPQIQASPAPVAKPDPSKGESEITVSTPDSTAGAFDRALGLDEKGIPKAPSPDQGGGDQRFEVIRQGEGFEFTQQP